MADAAEPGPGKNKSAITVEPLAPGWDPYEVWLTRIRPHQHLVGSNSALPHMSPFSYVRPRGKASKVMREVAFLLFPMSMKSLPPLARSKAIEITNTLLERGCDEGTAVRIAIAQAKRWANWRLDGL